MSHDADYRLTCCCSQCRKAVKSRVQVQKETTVSKIMNKLKGTYTLESGLAVELRKALLHKLSYVDMDRLLVMLINRRRVDNGEQSNK